MDDRCFNILNKIWERITYKEPEYKCITEKPSLDKDKSRHWIQICKSESQYADGWGAMKCHYELVIDQINDQANGRVADGQLFVDFHGESKISTVARETVQKELERLSSSGLVHSQVRPGDSYCAFTDAEFSPVPFVGSDDEIVENAVKALKSFVNKHGDAIDHAIEKAMKGDETMNNTTQSGNLLKDCVELLKNNHNVILHGAPGTGKTYLAKEIAKEMGCDDGRIGFVQFHQSYDYTDFVEGLRPKNKDGSDEIGFEPKDGIFKEFCAKALKNPSGNGVDNFDEIWDKLFEKLNAESVMKIPSLSGRSEIPLEINEYGDGLASRTYENDKYEPGKWIRGQSKFFTKQQCYNIYRGSKGIPSGGHDNYRKAIVEYMKKELGLLPFKADAPAAQRDAKPFVFIIDEINRGEMSKIFGELFFSIDPGYRGTEGAVKTQYANLQESANVFDLALAKPEGDCGHFFVPENVYIIGTMNDIDRSVESMDFAMRRRFAFKEVTAECSAAMLDDPAAWKNGAGETVDVPSCLDKIKASMKALNDAIWKKRAPEDKEKQEKTGLTSAYHIGGAYFLKFANYFDGENEAKAFQTLWNNHLEGLLREYLRGMDSDGKKLEALQAAYDSGWKVPEEKPVAEQPAESTSASEQS